MYWRIIRTNSDGSIRLLYAGTSTDSSKAYIISEYGFGGAQKLYSPAPSGYMYGSEGVSLDEDRANTSSSEVKTLIDKWYSNTLVNYASYVSDTAIYCNDRSIGSGTYNTGSTTLYYGAYVRTNTGYGVSPTYNCSVTADKFTVDSSTGNGKLTYPIALMTTDEAMLAGSIQNVLGASNYLYTSINEWWTMSPHRYYGKTKKIYMFVITNSSSNSNLINKLTPQYVSDNAAVRPVLSIKGTLKWVSGDGTASNPYKVTQ